MTGAERISLIRPKLDRAAAHIDELKRELKKFFDTKPYEVTTKRDPDRRLVYYISRVQDIPSCMPAIAGDAIQNIRSALDHLAYQLVDVGTNGTGPFQHVYFPIAENLTKYQAKNLQQTRGMHPSAIAAIDALRPYRGGNDVYWWIQSLNIIDKHRLLIALGSANQFVNVGPHLFKKMSAALPAHSPLKAELESIGSPRIDLEPSDRLFPLKAGKELFIDQTDAEVTHMDFGFSVVFGEQDVEGKPLFETLQDMLNLVRSTVKNFEPLLDQRIPSLNPPSLPEN